MPTAPDSTVPPFTPAAPAAPGATAASFAPVSPSAPAGAVGTFSPSAPSAPAGTVSAFSGATPTAPAASVAPYQGITPNPPAPVQQAIPLQGAALLTQARVEEVITDDAAFRTAIGAVALADIDPLAIYRIPVPLDEDGINYTLAFEGITGGDVASIDATDSTSTSAPIITARPTDGSGKGPVYFALRVPLGEGVNNLILSGDILHLNTDTFNVSGFLSITGTNLRKVKKIGSGGSTGITSNSTITEVDISGGDVLLENLGSVEKLRFAGCSSINLVNVGRGPNFSPALVATYVNCQMDYFTLVNTHPAAIPPPNQFLAYCTVDIQTTSQCIFVAPPSWTLLRLDCPAAMINFDTAITLDPEPVFPRQGVQITGGSAASNDATLLSIRPGDVAQFSGQVIHFMTGGLTSASAARRTALVAAGVTIIY